MPQPERRSDAEPGRSSPQPRTSRTLAIPFVVSCARRRLATITLAPDGALLLAPPRRVPRRGDSLTPVPAARSDGQTEKRYAELQPYLLATHINSPACTKRESWQG
jgi:hypothetical protein